MINLYFGHVRPSLDDIKEIERLETLGKINRLVGSFCDPYSFPYPSSVLSTPSFAEENIFVNHLPTPSVACKIFISQPFFLTSHPSGYKIIVGSPSFINPLLSSVKEIIFSNQEVEDKIKETYGLKKENNVYSVNKEFESYVDKTLYITDTREREVKKAFPQIFKEEAIAEYMELEKRGDESRYKLVDTFKDTFLTYKLFTPSKDKKKEKVLFTITSCKRLDLFKKTINSFINCCLDINEISEFLCVDDNSSVSDRKEMENFYPFFKFIWKEEKDKGHVKSMNTIRSYAISNGYDYLLHIEDDFHFFSKRHYVSDAITILKQNDKYGQCLFNLNYYEVLPHQRGVIAGGLVKEVDKIKYAEHEYCPPGSREAINFNNKYKGMANCAYWPHFSFRPSLLKVSMLKEVGPYYATSHFEMAYAYDYIAKGFISVFFNSISCLHIGRKTWERDTGVNSYTLNQVDQFSNSNKALDIVVLSENNINSWIRFKEQALNSLPFYRKVEVKPLGLQEEDRFIFYNNKFGYDQHVITYIKTFISLIRDNKYDYLVILHEDNVFSSLDIESLIKESVYFKSFDSKINPFSCILRKDACEDIIRKLSSKGVKDLDFLTPLLSSTVEEEGVKVRCQKNFNLDIRHEEIKGFQYYGALDHFGDDITCVGQLPPREIARLCREKGGIAFNTLGYIKRRVNTDENRLNLLGDKRHGLYINYH